MKALLAACGLLMCGTIAHAATYDQLVKLSGEWRQFEQPKIDKCLPDYSPAAMAEKAKGLAAMQQKLAAIDRKGWSVGQENDYALIEAEMKGLDFNLRVLKQWARDPSFYATIYNERSDVPAHEGSSASPVIDLFAYKFPLSASDQAQLTCLVGAIPKLLEDAKVMLKDSNAHDLWLYGGRAFREQSATLAEWEAGTLSMRTLEGPVHGTLEGASPQLKAAVAAARKATDEFGAWVVAQAPSKTGPSGVGKENYDWYEKNVHLVPYGWDEQMTLLQRELERSHAALRLEEFHNRNLPEAKPIDDPQAFPAFAKGKMKRITDFMISAGIVPEKDYYRAAMMTQAAGFVAPDKRNFFEHGIARDPLGLYSHDYHWIELARLKYEPNASPIRRLPVLSNMFDTRSEGLATAMEELFLHAGLYDDDPRGREIVWIMLANRAARGIASLKVQANEMNLLEAGQFHARWTPRGWSDAKSDLVAFEQLLYLRQPGYGASYIIGKLQFDKLITDVEHQKEEKGQPFSLPDFFAGFNKAGIMPFALIDREMTNP